MDSRVLEEEYCWALKELLDDEELLGSLNEMLNHISIEQIENDLLSNFIHRETLNEYLNNKKENTKTALINLGISELALGIITLIANKFGVDVTNYFVVGSILFMIAIPLCAIINNRREENELLKSSAAIIGGKYIDNLYLEELFEYTKDKCSELENKFANDFVVVDELAAKLGMK